MGGGFLAVYSQNLASVSFYDILSTSRETIKRYIEAQKGL
jgi:hypothetical protein